MQVTKLHSSFNLNHQQQAEILGKCCKKNISHDNSPGTSTEHKFFVKTLELLRKRNHDLLINTHLAKNIQQDRF